MRYQNGGAAVVLAPAVRAALMSVAALPAVVVVAAAVLAVRRQAQKASAAEAPTDDPLEGSASNKRTKVEAPLPSPTPAGRSYFLMKSEADVFSIDDLASRPNQTEPWDGVRNHQAKKIIQSMRVGDQALFWASNTKAPGVVGTVEIAREYYPDPTQFDSKSDYYDAKASEDDPKWFCVDVKLVRKLEIPVTLAELKKHAEGALSGMALFKMKRLSVQPVSAEEWEYVLGLEGSGGKEEEGEKEKGKKVPASKAPKKTKATK